MNIAFGHQIILIASISAMCIASIIIVSKKDLILSTIMLGPFSLFSIVAYNILKSPDVAITEVSIGTGISFVLTLFAIGITEKTKEKISGTGLSIYSSDYYSRIFHTITAILLFLLLMFFISLLPPLGDPNAIHHSTVAKYYIDHTYQDTGINNMVTMILGGYRGFDTLIETTVTFLAAFGVHQILYPKFDNLHNPTSIS